MQRFLEMKALRPLYCKLPSNNLFFSTSAGKNPRVQNSNMPRECIREFFPNRKCFTFDRPTSDKNLLFHIENVREDHLDGSFQVQSKKFRSYILDNSRTKTLREGIIVTGNRKFAPKYVSVSVCVLEL